MCLLEPLITNFVTILLALIAGSIALYQVKLNAISNARLKRLESTQDDVSKFIVAASKLFAIRDNTGKKIQDLKEGEKEALINESYQDFFKLAAEVGAYASRIRISLNLDKETENELNTLINKIQNGLTNVAQLNLNAREFESDLENLITLTRKYIKGEWDKTEGFFKK